MCLVCLLLYKEEGSSPVSLQLMRGGICLDVVVILLFNVMEVFSVGGGALLDRPCMVYQIMCCACDPSVYLSVGFLYMFACWAIISSFESWITGVYSPYIVPLRDFAYYAVG